MIVQIRGESGSGKSTLVRQMIRDFHGEVIEQRNRPDFVRPNGKRVKLDLRRLDGGLYVLGNYNTMTGKGPGGDAISGPVGIEIMRHYASKIVAGPWHLIWEGKWASQTRAVGEWLDVLREFRIVWATLDTPVTTCVERVRGRGGGISDLHAFASAHRRIVRRHVEVAQASGVRCETLNHERAYDDLVALLREGGWQPT